MAIAPARTQTTREAGPTSLAPSAVATYTSAPMIDPTTRLVTSNVPSLVVRSRTRPRPFWLTGPTVCSKLKTRRELDLSSDELCFDRTGFSGAEDPDAADDLEPGGARIVGGDRPPAHGSSEAVPRCNRSRAMSRGESSCRGSVRSPGGPLRPRASRR